MKVAAQDLFVERFFELKREAEKKNIVFSKSMYAVFHDGYMNQYENMDADLETFFVIPEQLKDIQNIRKFGGFQGISCTYVGSYGSMKQCYLNMEIWAKERSIELMNASIEIYIVGPELSVCPQNYVTQIIIPIKNNVSI